MVILIDYFSEYLINYFSFCLAIKKPLIIIIIHLLDSVSLSHNLKNNSTRNLKPLAIIIKSLAHA